MRGICAPACCVHGGSTRLRDEVESPVVPLEQVEAAVQVAHEHVVLESRDGRDVEAAHAVCTLMNRAAET
eukprot:5826326-Pleurochrysis_carterae.AAC.2